MRVSHREKIIQEFLPGLSPVASAVEELAQASTDDRGAIFTRKEVVNFILDLVGYVPTIKLQEARLLEPSFGHGDFLIPAIERLLDSVQKQKIKPNAKLLINSVRGVELHAHSFDKTKARVRDLLLEKGISAKDCDEIIKAWFVQGDFLLTSFSSSFTHVVGNPPYIRQEMIPGALLVEYRRRFETIYDRADIYVPFMEHSLSLLSEGGVLGFICADRWMKNKYGGPLRDLVARKFHLRMYIDMVGTAAFHSDVIAYPAITVIANEPSGPTYLAKKPEIDFDFLQQLANSLTEGNIDGKTSIKTATIGDGPWALEESDALTLVRRLEKEFPTLEETGCKVGIGVATGADNVFIAPLESLDVETSRKLPLIMTKDIRGGNIEWRGQGVINPFDNSGKLVSLEKYTKLREYLDKHSDIIMKRHVSKKNPKSWYRTIDRIYPELVKKEKLLIPDITGDANIVYDEGKYYPHHNLYHITSDGWDLQALRAVLLSGIAQLFIETYSTRMHGNCLRFQAQYLRRIRLPYWKDVPKDVRNELKKAGRNDDPIARDEAVCALYSLTPAERAIIKK